MYTCTSWTLKLVRHNTSSNMKRRGTYVRTILSEPKFLGCKLFSYSGAPCKKIWLSDNQIFFHGWLRCKKLWYATRQPRYLLVPFADKTSKGTSNTSLHSKRVSNSSSSRESRVSTSDVVISRLFPPKVVSLQSGFPCASLEIILYVPAMFNYGHRNLFFVVGYGKVQHILVILV